MKVIGTAFDGVYIIENFMAKDERGMFVKTFNKDFFDEYGLCTVFKESYYSESV